MRKEINQIEIPELSLVVLIGISGSGKSSNATAALEAMSRFAINPKWLLYLPPTMSPSETSKLEDHLEYPPEAFNYFGGRL